MTGLFLHPVTKLSYLIKILCIRLACEPSRPQWGRGSRSCKICRQVTTFTTIG